MLAVHRQHAHAVFAASLITVSPAMTRISLDATAMSLPARIAASAGCNPAVPTMAMSTMSASGCVASFNQPFRTGINLAIRAECAAQFICLGRIIDGNRDRPMLARLLDQQQLGIIARRQSDQPDAIRQILRHLDGAGADGAGAAENDDVFHG
jgi:hypothetical protein